MENDDAVRGRMIDVPLPLGRVGAFEDLHGFGTHVELVAELLRVARANHGVVARKFIRALADKLDSGRDATLVWLQGPRQRYLEFARSRVVTPNRDLERVHQKFATIYAAGCLAIRYGILPLKPKELRSALIDCERAHVDHVAQFVSAVAPASPRLARFVDDPLERLRAHVRERGPDFVDLRKRLLDRDSGHDHKACEGYLNRGSDGRDEYLFSAPKFVQVCGGVRRSDELKARLDEAGWLARDGHRPSTRRGVWRDGGRVGVIAIRVGAFDDQLPGGERR